ncbi:MAG: NAD(P)/FAD-dependent oxidoreductase [Actinomycetota bacterium]
MGAQEIETDVVVLGMGIGGEAVAGSLAGRGLDVVGIESELVGGECPYWGCLPSKMIVRAATLLTEARRVDGVAGTATVEPDFTPVAERIRDEATAGWDDTIAVDRFTDQGGTFVRGEGRLDGPGRVTVGNITYVARRGVVVASGTTAYVPPIEGIDEVDHWTNREAVSAKELPGSLITLGGGAIGLELSQAFGRFGTEVTVVEAADRILPREEPEASAALTEVLESEGVGVITGVAATGVRRDGEEVVVTLADGRELRAERLLVAVGRQARLEGIGLETVGITPSEHRFLPTDDALQVREGLWGVGDVTGRGAFTHVAAHQAKIVVAAILGEDEEVGRRVDAALPAVTFTDPEVGSVGLTEADAREAGLDVAVATQNVPWSARGWLHGPGNEGVIKLVADTERQVLVGASSVGPHGGEVLGLLALAVHAEVPIDTLRSMIYAYPTFHRGIEDALDNLA